MGEVTSSSSHNHRTLPCPSVTLKSLMLVNATSLETAESYINLRVTFPCLLSLHSLPFQAKSWGLGTLSCFALKHTILSAHSYDSFSPLCFQERIQAKFLRLPHQRISSMLCNFNYRYWQNVHTLHTCNPAYDFYNRVLNLFLDVHIVTIRNKSLQNGDNRNYFIKSL